MELVTVSKEKKEKIRLKYGVDDTQIATDVRIIEEWLVKQPHLPQKLPFDNFIEKILLNSKFRVETTKEKMDTYFTTKNITKDYYALFVGSEYRPPLKNSVNLIALPRLGPQNERIILMNLDPDADLYEFHHYIQSTLALMELVMKYDYCDGVRVVVDCANYSLGHVKKFEVVPFIRTLTMASGGSCWRLLGVHLINFKLYHTFILKTIKATVKPKMAERFIVHDSLESLHEKVPKECLPQEYGGTLGPMADFLAKMNELVESNRQYLIDCPKYVSRESLRIGKSKLMTDLYGVDGTFKKLNVD